MLIYRKWGLGNSYTLLGGKNSYKCYFLMGALSNIGLTTAASYYMVLIYKLSLFCSLAGGILV